MDRVVSKTGLNALNKVRTPAVRNLEPNVGYPAQSNPGVPKLKCDGDRKGYFET